MKKFQSDSACDYCIYNSEEYYEDRCSKCIDCDYFVGIEVFIKEVKDER